METTTLSIIQFGKNLSATHSLTNTSTIIHGGLPSTQVDFLSEDLRQILIIVFYFVLQIPVLAFGIGTNILNIVIFRRSGLNDCISISFTALSISDLGYCTLFLTVRLIAVLARLFDLDGGFARLGLYGTYAMSYVVSFASLAFQDISVVITLFIVVQKCCCVAIPYIFKDVFTPGRTMVILTMLSLSMMSIYVAIFSGMIFSTMTSPVTNQTVFLLIVTTKSLLRTMVFWRVFNKLIFPVFSQAVTTMCLLVMAFQLRKSAKFRSSMGKDTTHTSDSGKSSGVLGYKERRAIGAVALVSVIYVISSLPPALLSLSRYVPSIGSFYGDPRYRTFAAFLENCQNILVHCSASINLFVYLKYNSKFKETADDIFSRCIGCRKIGELTDPKQET